MNFQEFEEHVKAITTDVVAEERVLSSFEENKWLKNKCHNMCKTLRGRIRRELAHIDNWEFVLITGLWSGTIPEGCSKDHEWMCITFNEQELSFDPTYIQYTRTEWTWEGCKQAVIDCCVVMRRDDSNFSQAYKEWASMYPSYKNG